MKTLAEHVEEKNLVRTLQLGIEVEEVQNTLSCGFRIEHLSADNDEVEFTMDTGAGCGSPWISGKVAFKDGKTHHYRIDARKLVYALVDKFKEGDDD
jgi:hypothetical protein